MEWKLSEEQQTYQDTLRGWLGDVAAPETVRAWFDEGDVTTFADRFAADGWTGVGVAEERGGQGGGVVELAITAEELGRAAAPSSTWLATMLAVPALGRFPEVATAWLLAAEEIPEETIARVRVDEAGRLTGEVPRALAAGESGAWVVVADAPGGRELRLVAADAAGVSVRPRRLLDRSRAIGDVTIDRAVSTALEADPSSALRGATDLAGVLVAADALGAMQRMLDLAVEYSKQRHQFGVPIGSFQAVKHAAATIEVAVEAARSAVYFAAASVEAGLPDRSLHASAVKAQVTADAARAADTALTMHGAIGYTWEHDLHLLYKRARLDEQLAGAPARWNERIADGLALV